MSSAKRFFFFLTKENWVEWQCVRLFISFYDLFWPFLKRFPWNKSWKCRGTKSYHLSNSVQEYQCTYDNPINITRARWLYQTYGKKSLKKLTLMFFSVAKVNQLHFLLFHHLATLKLQSFLVKNVLKIFTFKGTKHIKYKHEF